MRLGVAHCACAKCACRLTLRPTYAHSIIVIIIIANFCEHVVRSQDAVVASLVDLQGRTQDLIQGVSK